MMTDKPNLKAAYAVDSPDAIKNLYRDWADTYDTTFVDSQGYQVPRHVASAFVEAGGTGPVLDVGAGTGVVGEHLTALGVTDVSGVDLSADMLRVAASKGVYSSLIEADITQPLPGDPKFAGVVSSGTFTLGHVGPEGVVSLLQTAVPGALFVIAVNLRHFQSAGFEAMLEDIADQITDLTFSDVQMYDDRADVENRDDKARLLIFKTA